jgi:hypothetical protein
VLNVTDRSFVRSRGVRLPIALLLVLAGLVCAACGGDDIGEPVTVHPGLVAQIKYEVIGGDAFRDDKITVQADGRASVQTRSGSRTAKLTDRELLVLARGVDEAGLTRLQSAVTDPPQPDAVSYRFTYRGRQVETDTGKLPGELHGLIRTFDELIARYGS